MYPQQTRKSPLLPTPPAPISSHKKITFQDHLSGAANTIVNNAIRDHIVQQAANNDHPCYQIQPFQDHIVQQAANKDHPCLPTTFYHYIIPAYYEADTIGPYQHTMKQTP